MPWVLIGGEKYERDALQKLSPREPWNGFEQSAIAFCQAWLAGEKIFSLQTSGSTGAPKSITLARTQMEASAQQTINALQLKAGETSLVCLDTKYIAGQMMLARSLMAEMNIVIIPPSANPFENVYAHAIDFVALVPYQLEAVLDHALKPLDKVRCAIVGGAAVTDALRDKTAQSQCSIFATYGMTETLSHIALQQLNGANAKDYFEAFDNIYLRQDSRGCLCIQADYLGSEIITNDLVTLIGKRGFRWLGRIDHVINSGGVKIVPECVEMVMEKIFGAMGIGNRFLICGLPDSKLGNKVVMLIEGSAFSGASQSAILAAAGDGLSRYEVPKSLLFIDRFQETPTGKVNRAATAASIEALNPRPQQT